MALYEYVDEEAMYARGVARGVTRGFARGLARGLQRSTPGVFLYEHFAYKTLRD